MAIVGIRGMDKRLGMGDPSFVFEGIIKS